MTEYIDIALSDLVLNDKLTPTLLFLYTHKEGFCPVRKNVTYIWKILESPNALS